MFGGKRSYSNIYHNNIYVYIFNICVYYIYIYCSDANTGVIGKQQRVQNPNLAEKKERIYQSVSLNIILNLTN